VAFGERRSELAILGGEGADPAVKSRDGFGGRTGDSFGHDDTSDKYHRSGDPDFMTESPEKL
jgi:hypothetical protein